MKKLGIALGSGGARGFAHIGVLKSLEENNIPISCIAGTSSGSIVGGHYALYKDIKAIEQFAYDFIEEEPFSLFGVRSLADKHKREQRIKYYLEDMFRVKKFEDCQIPFSAVTCNLESAEEFIINKGRLAPAIFASSSVPGVFGPSFFWGLWLADGGLINPTPVSVARDMGADYVLGVDSNIEEDKTYNKKPGTINTIFRSIDILIKKVSESRLKDVRNKMVVYPKFTKGGAVDKKKTKEFIELGYKTMEEKIDELKSELK